MAERIISTTIKKLEFVGPPRSLVAVGEVPVIKGEATISGNLAKHLPSDHQALRTRRGGRRAASLRLRLDPLTPPGDYKGKLSAGDVTFQIVARVLPEIRVSVLAGDLNFVGAAGTKARATLAIANNGNTEIQLPRAMAIGLFDDDGLEAAFAASYAKPLSKVDEFFEAFHGKLRESHSGIIKLAVTRGYGAHPPGKSFSAEFALDIAKSLKTGHRYHGVASTDYADLPISVSVTNGVVS